MSIEYTAPSGVGTDLDLSGNLTVGGSVELGVSGPTITTGTGSPESAVTAPVGSMFVRSDGGASTTLYVKESGAGSTGGRAV